MRVWLELEAYGSRHGVDPLLFAGLYAARMPVLLATFGWLATRIRRRASVIGVVILAATLWIIPYAYVLLFGHDLPWWFYVVLTVIVVLTGRQFVGRIVALRGEG
ncbi:MAG TPA: hypothetical protein VL595_24025 [Pseudonocardia sp.]|nr:hypothetical protein [Pseudonocardia sp.]